MHFKNVTVIQIEIWKSTGSINSRCSLPPKRNTKLYLWDVRLVLVYQDMLDLWDGVTFVRFINVFYVRFHGLREKTRYLSRTKKTIHSINNVHENCFVNTITINVTLFPQPHVQLGIVYSYTSYFWNKIFTTE